MTDSDVSYMELQKKIQNAIDRSVEKGEAAGVGGSFTGTEGKCFFLPADTVMPKTKSR